MEGSERSSIPQTEDFQIANSWFPTTPAKPSLPPIWRNRQQNQLAPENGLELKRISQGQGLSQVNQPELRSFLQEPAGRHVAAWRGSTNSATGTEYFDTREAAPGTKSKIYGDNNMYNNFSTDDVDKWSNVSFGHLLALAHAAGSTAAAENTETNFTMSGSFNPLASSQNADGGSICSRFPFNLNSPADEVLRSNNAVQFEPITPDQIKNKGGRASDELNLDINETPQLSHMRSCEDTLKRAQANDPQQKREQSGLVLNMSELQGSHKPDKADEQDAEQNNTPQQKQRRKKHRPKVVIEGQTKRTPKPKKNQQHSSKETTGEKRKYVRRNKVDEFPGTPSDKVDCTTTPQSQLPSSREIQRAKRRYVRRNRVNKPAPNPAEDETIDPPNISRPRRSCRRSLNFDSESRLSDESSSHWPSSTGEDLHENQSRSSVHLGRDIEVKTEKTELGTIYDIACSRGKCKIIFSDETHDKQASIIEMKPKSPNGSNCSSSACLIQETPEKALKRRHSFRTNEAELYSTNVKGAYFNSMQAYQAILPANEPYAHSTQGMHFPTIYKKKRTEKGHPTATSYAKPFTCETNYLSLSQCNIGLSPASTSANDKANNRMRNPELVPAFVEAEGLRRKRSKGISKVRDLASLLEICKHFPTPPAKEASISEYGERYSDKPNICMEALVADTRAIMKTKKGSKRSILVSSTASYMYAQQQFTTNARGILPAITWRSQVEEIAERL